MRLEEYGFRDYYHSYMILEADSLTEQLKNVLPIRDEDCFVLCSCYVAENRRLTFNVLAVGDAADHCRRGLRRRAMLGLYEYWHPSLHLKIRRPQHGRLRTFPRSS